MSTCKGSYLSLFSDVAGTVSFLTSFISLMPQIIETYHIKTVEGLSPYFLLCWLLGDITSAIGAIITKQLMFQILLSFYFFTNDLTVCLQYYYYGVIHNNELATLSHESKPILRASNFIGDEDLNDSDHEEVLQRIRSRVSNSNVSSRSAMVGLGLASLSNQASAYPLYSSSFNNQSSLIDKLQKNQSLGLFISWLGAAFYVGARVPQLIKNYKRKSTDGISPFLFLTTLLSNIAYNVSIFTSCRFWDTEDKIAFVIFELPFIFGSAGTIIFDLIYFYQHYVLYSNDMKIRQLEREVFATVNSNIADVDLETDDNTNDNIVTDSITNLIEAHIPTENTPLIS